MISKFLSFFFVKFADFRPFPEVMKYKKINDISEILNVLYCLGFFQATPNQDTLQ